MVASSGVEDDGWRVCKEQSSRQLWGVCGLADFGAEDRCGASVGLGKVVGIVYGVLVPFETPLHWIIQIGLSTDFRYMSCRVRGTHGLYAMPSRCPAALHSPNTPTFPPVLLVLVQAQLVLVLVVLLSGDQPNGIVDGRL